MYLPSSFSCRLRISRAKVSERPISGASDSRTSLGEIAVSEVPAANLLKSRQERPRPRTSNLWQLSLVGLLVHASLGLTCLKWRRQQHQTPVMIQLREVQGRCCIACTRRPAPLSLITLLPNFLEAEAECWCWRLLERLAEDSLEVRTTAA